jgi:small neutral amino acid transporter SnatA (MarC family)
MKQYGIIPQIKPEEENKMMKKALLRIFIISLALAFAGTICFAADTDNIA